MARPMRTARLRAAVRRPALAIRLRAMSSADVLIVTGGVLEIGGFGLVVAQLVRV